MDCIFCKIISGEIPCYKVYEDDKVLSFLDINPDVNGHTLVVPKKHIKDIEDIDSETVSNLLQAIKIIKKKLEVLNIDGLTLVQNNGIAQDVKHFHIHLKPVYKDKQELLDVKTIYEQLKNND